MSVPVHLKTPFVPSTSMPQTPPEARALTPRPLSLHFPGAASPTGKLSPSTSSSSSSLPVGVPPTPGRPVVPPDQVAPTTEMRKRKCEVLQAENPADPNPMADPDRYMDAFRDLLRGAATLPVGALQDLTRNLMAQRAGTEPVSTQDLQMLMDVLVSERNALGYGATQEALRGLLAGLGGTAIRPLLLEVLIKRVCCMGFGTPGRNLRTEVRTITATLVRGPDRLAMLRTLTDHFMKHGAGLLPSRLVKVWHGVSLGLRSVSARETQVDADLHQCVVENILRPNGNRAGYQLRAALTGLWECAFSKEAVTDTLRNHILNLVFACAHPDVARTMHSACGVITLWLCGGAQGAQHREAVLGTLVRESFRLDENVTAFAASGLGWGLGGNSISADRMEWLVATLARWQGLHPDAGWDAIVSGLEVQLGRRAFDEQGQPLLPRPARGPVEEPTTSPGTSA